MHRNVAIPDYRSLVTQTSGMDICQIRQDICEFDSLRGLGIDIIGRVHFDNRDRFAIWMGSIGKATKPCQQTSGCWHLAFDSFLNLDQTWELIRIRIFYCFVYRQHIWLRKWEVIFLGTRLIMLGFMDLGWPRVCRCSTSVLFIGFRPGKVLYPYAITNGGVFWLLPSLVNNNSIAALVMTSSNGNIFRVTGPLWGEFTCQRWVPHTTASDAELWCFVWFAPE